MYKIIYEENSLKIQENVAISGWHPLWNTIIEAKQFSDIDKELFAKLSEEDQEMIMYFFEDLEFKIESEMFINSNEYEDFKNS